MLDRKYLILIIIGIVICLILYYFYNQISNLKKQIVPIYQKTAKIEAQVLEFQKNIPKIIDSNKNSGSSSKNKPISKHDSSVYSITYHSDTAKNGNASIKCTDITETEAKEIAQKLSNLKKPNNCKHHDIVSQQSPFCNKSPKNIMSSIKKLKKKDIKNISPKEIKSLLGNSAQKNNRLSYDEKSDTINLKISKILEKDPMEIRKSSTINIMEKSDNDSSLESIDVNNSLPFSTTTNDNTKIVNQTKSPQNTNIEINASVVKSISETLQA